MEIFTGVIKESFFLLREMSPYLLFGFLFAGVLRFFIDTRMISRTLAGDDLGPVVRASLFGIPLPLCSCSVIPTAMMLKKEGASRGAVLSFLISTPSTGVDSIFATYSLLGWGFTVYRVLASFLTGVLAGGAANLMIKGEGGQEVSDEDICEVCGCEEGHEHTVLEKVKKVFNFSFGELLDESGDSLIAGILVGGIITFLLPNDFIGTYVGSGLMSMIIMLFVGIPMYVCATASIPIAAALMAKGLSPGAGFVFLFAGPATNIVTMSVVAKNMGVRALFVYLGSIVIGGVGLGLLLNWLGDSYSFFGQMRYMSFDAGESGELFAMICTVILLLAIARNLLRRMMKKW